MDVKEPKGNVLSEKCLLCGKHFKDKSRISKHVRIMHNKIKSTTQVEKCEDCGKLLTSKLHLNAHKKRMHKEKYGKFSLKCDICDFDADHKSTLSNHIQRKHKEKSVLCDLCNKAFALKSDLDIHLINKHSDTKPFKCSLCPSAFKRSCALQLHQRKHSNAKNYKCPSCLKSFKSNTSVKQCLRNHEKGDQKVPCPLPDCSKTVKSQELIRQHLMYHEMKGNREFTCSICFKSFVMKTDLTRHIKLVHVRPEKKFKCLKCPTSCLSETKLKRHEQIHEGKVFTCSIEGCSSKSNTQYGMNHHIKKKHGTISRKPDYIPLEKRPPQICTLCGKMLKPGPSPQHAMASHMKTHQDKSHLPCPVSLCQVRTKEYIKLTFKPPMSWFKHLSNMHKLGPEYVEIEFTCKNCPKVFRINCALVSFGKLKVRFKNHLSKAHGDLMVNNFVFGDQWNTFFGRKINLKTNMFNKTPRVDIFSDIKIKKKLIEINKEIETTDMQIKKKLSEIKKDNKRNEKQNPETLVTDDDDWYIED